MHANRGDAWLQTGYNFLYGCWKYSWDADCELFLKILRGEVKEDVYVEQIQLQVQSSAAGTECGHLCTLWSVSSLRHSMVSCRWFALHDV